MKLKILLEVVVTLLKVYLIILYYMFNMIDMFDVFN